MNGLFVKKMKRGEEDEFKILSTGAVLHNRTHEPDDLDSMH